MTKPLPTGYIKDNNNVSWATFNCLLEKVSFEDEIGHLYVVDVMLDTKNATEKQLIYNEIYPPIIEKQKIIDPCERSVYQLLEQYIEGANNNPLVYWATAKAHATMLQKRFFPMYLEHLAFLIKRAGWKVTKIDAYLTFEQKCFLKKIFWWIKNQGNYLKIILKKIFMNDWIIQISVTIVEVILSLFQYLTNLKKLITLEDISTFLIRVAKFVTGDLIRQDIEEKYNDKLIKLDKEDKFYAIELNSLNAEGLSSLKAAENVDERKKKTKEI